MLPERGRRRVKRCSYHCDVLEPRQLLAGTWAALTNPVPNFSGSNGDSAQTMLLLSDGTVMVHGNTQFQAQPSGPPLPTINVPSSAWYKLTPVNGNDYIHGTWTTLSPMSTARKFFPTVVLPSGKVLAVGGEYSLDNSNPPNVTQPYLTSGEIYDPLTDSWSNIKDFNTTGKTQFGDDPAVMLPDGRVLAGFIGNDGTVPTYIYSPPDNSTAPNTWTPTLGTKLHNDRSDEESWVTLPDGSIISYDVFSSELGTFQAQRYFPGSDTWVDASNLSASSPAQILSDPPPPPGVGVGRDGDELGPALLLPDGRAFFSGANGHTAYYTPSTNKWSAGFDIPGGYAATDDPAAMLPNGHVLIAVSPLGTLNPAGNAISFPSGVKVYEFDPLATTAAAAWTDRTPNVSGFDVTAQTNAYQTGMLVLPNGHVLMCNESGKLVEFTPDGDPNTEWRPYVSNITSVGFNIFHLTGFQLTGISEGAAYGDDNAMSSNYPIVQLQDRLGNVADARTFNWSIGVAQGGSLQSCDFSLPAGWDPDAYLVSVIANGIAAGAVLNVEMGAATTTLVELHPLNASTVEVLANGSSESTWPLASFFSVAVSGNNANETIIINDNFGTRIVNVNGSGGNDIVRVEANGGQTIVNGDDGDDFTDFAFYGHNLSTITGATTVNGGSGTDSIFVYDNVVSGNGGYSVNSNGMSRPGWPGFTYGTSIQYASLTTGTGNNPVSVTSTNDNQSIFLYSAGGADAVTVGNGGAQGILGNVEIHNTPNFTSLIVDDTNDFGSRDIIIDNSGSLGVLSGITGPIGGTISWANSDLSSLTVNLSQFGSGTVAVRAMSKPLTLHNVTVGNQGANYGVTLGNGTNGMQSIIGNVTLIAAFGQNQSLMLNDSADTTGRTTALVRSSLNGVYSVSGLAPGLITFQDFGSLTVQQGSGADSFTAGGTNQGGNNNDLPMTVNGNGGTDAYTLTSFNNWGEALFGDVTYPVMFDGGAGFNSLSIVDSARGNTSYQLYADRFFSREPTAFAVGSDFNYDNMGAIGVTCSNGNNPFAVYSTSSDIASGNQISVALSGGNDTVTMYPHDALGNLTINGTIGIGGSTGTDTMIFDDTGSTNGINYTFSNPFGASTQDVFGIGAAGMGYTSDFETATIKGGDGADTFGVSQYKSGVPLAIYGGGGDDTLNLGGNNLPANIIMGSGSFLFDGQAGFDRFNLNNSTEVSQWTYTGGMNVEANRGAPAGGYDVLFQGTHNEETTVNAGPGADTFVPAGIGSGTHVVFNGAGGMDSLQLSQNSTIFSLLKSKITFDAGDSAVYGINGGGSVVVTANVFPTAVIVHLTATTLGAIPGDNLLGAGGSLEFFHANSFSLTLGSGADTVYAAPNATATVNIIGGSPTTAPGDTLNLALAAAQGYVLHGTAASGNVTSTNLKTLTYSGFESGPNVDDVAPFVAAANINIDGAAAAAPAAARLRGGSSGFGPSLGGPSFDLQFSEDVALLAGTASIQLTNLTTGEIVPQDSIAMTYDPATQTAHFTFPGYPGGILPDGNYHGSIFAGSTDDFFGNTLAADAPLDFFILSGDANHDRQVDINDLYALASNWQSSGALFSQGDFNYDGTVDAADLGILASKWQQTLPEPLPAAPVSIAKRKPTRPAVRVVTLM